MARILVIEDRPDERAVVQEMLQSVGHEVTVAVNGLEGLKSYRAAPADLVITDLFMPEFDGLETITALRREFPAVKVIAVCGNRAAESMLLVAKRLGTVAILEKPFTLEQLLAAVEREI